MNTGYIHRYIFLVLACILIFISLRSLLNTAAEIGEREVETGIDTTALPGLSDELTEEALSADSVERLKEILWKGDSPFRDPDGVSYRRRKKRSSAPSYTRETLILNGTLIKDNPLALLEDRRGQTYIKAVGDSVAGREILSIGEDSVKIKDPAGVEVLYVSKE